MADSIETQMVQKARETIAGLSHGGGGEFKATCVPQSVEKAVYGTVLVLDGKLRVRDQTEARRWHTLLIVLVVVSKLNSETADVPAVQLRNNDVKAVYAALQDAEPFQAVAGSATVKRGEIAHYTWPSGDVGRPAGGIFGLEITWSE